MKTKMFRRAVSALLALVMIFTALPLESVFAAVAEENLEAEGYRFSVYKNEAGVKVAAITGCSQPTGDIIIPEKLQGYPVAEIGSYAFCDCYDLTSVVLPDSLTGIGDAAFYYCKGMTSVSLPDGLTSIGSSAFSYCRGLTSVSLPDGLTSLGSSAFSYCTGLTGVSLPDGLTSLPDGVFLGCNSLPGVSLPNSLTSIGYFAFSDCDKLTGIGIPESVTNIGQWAFDDCPKVSLKVFPDSYAEIYAIENEIPYEFYNVQITLKLKSGDGSEISGDCSVYWYESGSGRQVGTGKTLHATVRTEYQYLILLGEELSYQYQQPDMGTVTAQEEGSSVDVILQPIGQVSISGTVKDVDGKVIDGASLKIKQAFGGYEKEFQQPADGQGTFGFLAANVDTLVTVSADGYYNSTYRVAPEKVKDGAYAIDAVLNAMPQNRVELSLSMKHAAASGETADSNSLSSTDGMAFTLFNETQGQGILDFVVQYPYMVIGEGRAKEGDVIRISVADKKGQMTAEDVTLTLDEDRCGEASIQFVQNGRFTLNAISGNNENTVMVFDRSGRIAESGSASINYTSSLLTEGTYDVIVIKKSAVLRSVPRIDVLDEFGLKQGEDYAKKSVKVSNGEITVINSVAVPQMDESRLYYTVSDQTHITAGQSTAVAGRYVTMRAQYEIDSKYASSDEKVRIEIPDGMSFVDGSLTVDGKKSTYSREGNNVTVNVGKSSGTVRFYLLAVDAGTWDVHAYLDFKKDGEEVAQPIGKAAVDVTVAKITVPEKTCGKSVTVSGKAVANSEIMVYDNGTAVGTTASNKNGSWSLTFDLISPLSYSWHSIYAVITDSSRDLKIQTETAGLVYDKGYAMPDKVTMYNTAHPYGSLEPTEFVTVFDFQNPSAAVPNYNYWPQYPTFTFKAEFLGGDADTLNDVYVVTTDSGGDETYVKCTYDEVTGAWIGTHDYTSFSDVPCSATVSYGFEREGLTEQKLSDEETLEYIEGISELTESMQNEMEDSCQVENMEESDNHVQFDIVQDTTDIAKYSMDLLEYSEFSLDKWEENGYLEFEDEEGNPYYTMMTADDSGYMLYLAYPEEKALVRQTIDFSEDGSAMRLAGISDSETLYNGLALSYEAYQAVGDIVGLVTGIEDIVNAYNYVKTINANISMLSEKLETIKKILSAKDCNGDYALQGGARSKVESEMASLEKELNIYKLQAWGAGIGSVAVAAIFSFGAGRVAKVAGKLAFKGSKYLYRLFQKKVLKQSGRGRLKKIEKLGFEIGSDLVEEKVEDIFSSIQDCLDVFEAANKKFTNLYSQMDGLMAYAAGNSHYLCQDKTCGESCTCGCRHPKEDEPRPEPEPVKPIEDPSGYVYEAVPSNRVEGVRAEIYYYDYAEDEFGIQKEEKEEILWDAEDYDQINPQYTDRYGSFGWDVPQGQWLVKFSKDGYYNTDTRADVAADEDGYLPVPPPQTEVNTAIVSKAAPAVKHVNVYKDEVQIEFSQYMQIGTVSSANVTVSCGGKAVSGSIAPSNAEYNYEGTVEYASVFVFRPDQDLSGKASVTVGNVKNYNGTAIGQEYSGEHAVVVKPESIKTSAAVELVYNGNAELDIQILPAGAGAGQTLTAASYSPSVVGVSSGTVKADKDGHASIKLNGNLPGKGVVRVSLEGTQVSSDVTVEVKPKDDSEEPGDNPETPGDKKIPLDKGSYTVTLPNTSYTYDGKKKEPAVTVKSASATLRKGTDYTVTYRNNINAGTATATITGIGSYTGTLEKTFRIGKAKTTITASGMTKTASGKATTFSIKAKCSRSCSLTYSSTDKKVKVSKKGKVTIPKNFVGKVGITIKAAATGNYEAASRKITVTVNPAGVKLVSAKSMAAGKLTVKWKKNAKAAGYEIQYSTNKKFAKSATKIKRVKKASKTGETISKLKKGKIYYVRIRTYKKASGKTYYSGWSSKKKVKIRK